MDIEFDLRKLPKEGREWMTDCLEYVANSPLLPEKYNYCEPINKPFNKKDIPAIVDGYFKAQYGSSILLRTNPRIGMWLNLDLDFRNLDVVYGLFRCRKGDRKKPALVAETFMDMFAKLKFEYSFIALKEEVKLRNYYEDEEPNPPGVTNYGKRRGGVFLDEGYPGLYWMNFFGKKSIGYFGRKRLLTCPAHKVYDLGSEAIAIQLYERPEDYEKTDIHGRALAHLGEESFFDVRRRDRELASKHVITVFHPKKFPLPS